MLTHGFCFYGGKMLTVTKTACPVCGKEVDTASKFNTYYMSVPRYFCSVEHKLRFDRDPRTFASKTKETAAK